MTGLEILAVGAVISLVAGVFRASFEKADVPTPQPRDPIAKPREGQEIGVVFGTVLIEDLAIIHEHFTRYLHDPGFVTTYAGLQRLEVNALAGICEGVIDGVVAIETRHDDGRILSLAGGRPELAYDHPQAWCYDRQANGPAIQLFSQTWGQVEVGATVGEVRADGGVRANYIHGQIGALSGLQSASDLTAGILPAGNTNTPETGAFPGRAGNVALLRWTGAVGAVDNSGNQLGFSHGWGSPTMRPYSVWVERLQRDPITGAFGWEYTRAAIPGRTEIAPGTYMTWFDRNPIHCIRELLLDPTMGLGLSVNDVDNTSFVYAAAVCESEGFGVSFRLTAATSARAVIDQLLATINGVLWEDGEGRLQLRLVRELLPGEVAALTVLDASTCESISWQEPAVGSLPTSVRVRYWSPWRRGEVTIEAHNDAEILARGGQVTWADAYAFGVGDDDTLTALVARELAYRTRPAAAVEARVLREAVGPAVRPGWAVVVDWDYAPPTVFRVISLDWGAPDAEWVTLRLVEDVFVARGVLVLRPTPDVPVPSQPVPLEPTLVYEQPPYWMLEADQMLARDLGIEGDLPSVGVVGQGYAVAPDLEHTSWVLAEQPYAGSAPVRRSPTHSYAYTVQVRASYHRAQSTTVGTHTLLLDTGTLKVTVGHVLRVPVEYPELDGWSYAFGDDYEYVVVVGATVDTGPLAEVTVQRGAIDTASAPTILVGEALIAGWARVGGEGAWYADMWVSTAQLGGYDLIPRAPTIVLHGTVDVRALGRIGQHELAWDDATQAWRARTSSTGTGIYVSRARRPVSPGACWVEESGGTVTVYAQARSHLDQVMRVASARDDQTAEPTQGLWHTDTLECHVFDDTLQWVGQADPYDGEKFVLSSGDIAGWGGPWDTMHLAVLAVRPGDDPIGSWQYCHLAIDNVGAVYDESATALVGLVPEAHESLITPGVFNESATAIVGVTGQASEQVLLPIFDESATAIVGVTAPEADEHLGSAAVYIGAQMSTANQAQTAGGSWTPSFGAISGARNDDLAILAIMTDRTTNLTPSGWSLVRRMTTSRGSLQVFYRTVAPGWNNGNNAISVPHEAGIAATLTVIRGMTHMESAGSVQAVTTGNQSVPNVSTPAPSMPQLKLALLGHSALIGDSAGSISVTGWSAAAQTGVTSGGQSIEHRAAYTTAQSSSGGLAGGAGAIVSSYPSDDTLAAINLILWRQE